MKSQDEISQQLIAPIETTDIQFWIILATIFFTALAVWIITAAIQRKRARVNAESTKEL